MRRSGLLSNLMVFVTISCAFRAVPAVVYTVGDSSGWAMGTDYGTWVSDKTFNVGDTIVFNYSPGHTVDEVSENEYKSCTTGNYLSTDSSGATAITLSTAGTHYYICGVPGHCNVGMKLSINVAAPAPAGAASSPPSTTTITSPSPSPLSSVSGTLSHNQPLSSAGTVLLSSAVISWVFSIVMLKFFMQ